MDREDKYALSSTKIPLEAFEFCFRGNKLFKKLYGYIGLEK